MSQICRVCYAHQKVEIEVNSYFLVSEGAHSAPYKFFAKYVGAVLFNGVSS